VKTFNGYRVLLSVHDLSYQQFSLWVEHEVDDTAVLMAATGVVNKP
jgi:hypothetical protein